MNRNETDHSCNASTPEARVLVVGEAGVSTVRLFTALSSMGVRARFATDDDELFDCATGREAIVLLDLPRWPAAAAGAADDQRRAWRLERVLAASNAPSQQLVVVVVPEAGDPETLHTLRRYGAPFVVLRCPVLVEDVAEAIDVGESRHLWLPAVGRWRVASVQGLAAAIADALETESQGAEVAVASDELDVAALVRCSVDISGADVRVHDARLSFYDMARRVMRALAIDASTVYGLADQLVAQQGQAGGDLTRLRRSSDEQPDHLANRPSRSVPAPAHGA